MSPFKLKYCTSYRWEITTYWRTIRLLDAYKITRPGHKRLQLNIGWIFGIAGNNGEWYCFKYTLRLLVNIKIMAAFQGMHVSPANHTNVWPRKAWLHVQESVTTRQTNRRWTKQSLCVALLRWQRWIWNIQQFSNLPQEIRKPKKYRPFSTCINKHSESIAKAIQVPYRPQQILRRHNCYINDKRDPKHNRSTKGCTKPKGRTWSVLCRYKVELDLHYIHTNSSDFFSCHCLKRWHRKFWKLDFSKGQ